MSGTAFWAASDAASANAVLAASKKRKDPAFARDVASELRLGKRKRKDSLVISVLPSRPSCPSCPSRLPGLLLTRRFHRLRLQQNFLRAPVVDLGRVDHVWI